MRRRMNRKDHYAIQSTRDNAAHVATTAGWSHPSSYVAGALVGILVPTIAEGLLYLRPFVAGTWLVWVWPSSLLLMTIRWDATFLYAALVLATSIAINVALYAVLGRIVAGICSRIWYA